MNTTATFLGPVNQLPAEGSDQAPTGKSEVEACASMFAESQLWFDVSVDGVTLVANPQETELFQLFTLEVNENNAEATPAWGDQAYEISLQGLFPDAASFETLSDASEPEDFVRRFLEVISSSLKNSDLKAEGTTLPLIRWQAGDDGNSARVQLLGLLLANEDQFQAFCRNNSGEFGFIFEDAEIQAHGAREVITVLALLGITLGSVTSAEAGIFKPLAKKEMRIQQVAYSSTVKKAPAPIQQQQSGWMDVHQDAYFNQALLDYGKSNKSTKKIVVDISKQRAYLLVDGQIAIDTAVSTARSGKYTPRGEFKITERVQSGKTSTIYGCSLPYWQRLDQSAVGMHVGDLPGYPASAGCIRLPHSVAPVLFANTASGVTVQIVDSWSGPAPQAAPNIIVAQVVQQ
ncbi:MAG: L,D-transpeptidase family protein [Verrucomicrobiales bacterium]|nr:L,D-transpeptidase family protein [Verrucomicrobiales bacterium]